jgi:hypothetical protein
MEYRQMTNDNARQSDSPAWQRAIIMLWCCLDCLEQISEMEEPPSESGRDEMIVSFRFNLEIAADLLDSEVREFSESSLTLMRKMVNLLGSASDSTLAEQLASRQRSSRPVRKAVARV